MHLVREGLNKAFFDQLPRREYAHCFLYKLASAADNLSNSQQNPFYSHNVIATILWCRIVLYRFTLLNHCPCLSIGNLFHLTPWSPLFFYLSSSW